MPVEGALAVRRPEKEPQGAEQQERPISWEYYKLQREHKAALILTQQSLQAKEDMSLFSHAAFMITKAGQVREQVATLTLTNHHTGNGAKAYNSCQSVREIQQATMLVG